MPGSDSSTACAWGVRLAPSPTGPRFAAGAAQVSRFSCGEFPDVPGFPRPRRARAPLANTRRTIWPSPSVHRVGARKSGFRGSIAGPPVPLSTLHPRCRHRRRMTRGQRGSLLLHCGALSSPTLRRFIPALSLRPFSFFSLFLDSVPLIYWPRFRRVLQLNREAMRLGQAAVQRHRLCC